MFVIVVDVPESMYAVQAIIYFCDFQIPDQLTDVICEWCILKQCSDKKLKL